MCFAVTYVRDWVYTKRPHCLHDAAAAKGAEEDSSKSHLSARQSVFGQFDFGEVALADGLQQAVVADVRLFVRDGRAAARRQTVAARRFGGRRRRIWEAVRSLYLWETQTVIVKHLAHCDSSGYPGRQRGATGKRTRTSSVYDTADDSTHNIVVLVFVV